MRVLHVCFMSRAGRIYVPQTPTYGRNRIDMIIDGFLPYSRIHHIVNWWLLPGSSRRTLIGTGQTRCLSTALILYNKMQRTAKRINGCTLRYIEERTAGHHAKVRFVHGTLLSFNNAICAKTVTHIRLCLQCHRIELIFHRRSYIL
jgi:hypothetical protein